MAPIRLVVVVLGMMGYGCVHVVVPCYYYKKEHRIKEQSTTKTNERTAALFLKTHFLLFLLTHTGLTAAVLLG